MFDKLIARLFKKKNSPERSQINRENEDLRTLIKPEISSRNANNTSSNESHLLAKSNDEIPNNNIDIPVPQRTITISVASLNRLDFLFYDFLLGPSKTTSTLNPIEQYILTRVNHALKSPESVLTEFPVLPQSVIKLTNLLNDPDFNLGAFIEVVEQEPSIATELMKKANSPAYRRGDKDINNLQQAFMFMGANDVKEFVLNRFVKNLCQQKPIYFKTFGEKIWLHSQDVAKFAKTLATIRKQNADAAYTIGLMHDLGKVVIFQFMVEAFKLVDPNFNQDSLAFKKFLSEKSMRLSVELMKLWNMPSLIIEVVKGQTEEIRSLQNIDAMTAILFEANLVSEFNLSYQSGQISPEEFEILLAETILSDDAKRILRESLNLSDDALV